MKVYFSRSGGVEECNDDDKDPTESYVVINVTEEKDINFITHS